MLTATPTRSVQCYHCRRAFTVPARAMSCSCPHCYRRVTIDDLIVSDNCWAARLQTCGRLLVEKKGRLVAGIVEARVGMEVQGTIEGKVICGGRVVLGPRARVKGDLCAPAIWVEPGAIIEGGFFQIRPDEREATTDEPSTLITPARAHVIVPERTVGAPAWWARK